jgi:hypothetical protein
MTGRLAVSLCPGSPCPVAPRHRDAVHWHTDQDIASAPEIKHQTRAGASATAA